MTDVVEVRRPKTYTASQREKATTLPDGSFPIDNVVDLKRAISSFGRAKDKARVKAWIIRRARALGATDQLPEAWRSRLMDFDQDRVEARSVAFTDVDAASDGSTFTGYAAVFDVTADLGDFTESISRGAFRKALAGGMNVPMLYDHNPMLPVLATTRGGTLRLSEDTRGLRVEADVANHFMGDAVREMVRRGDISGMSFGFVAGQGNSKLEPRGAKPHRTLTGFKRLLDVSPTWDEAYQGTEATFRSLRALQMAEDIDGVQQFLSGAYQQLEDGAPADDVDTDDAEADTDETADGSPAESSEERSGAPHVRLAARRRRLSMLGITLPKEGQ